MDYECILPLINTAVLATTLFFVAKYTIITNKLHNTSILQLAESIRQRQLSLVPLIKLELLAHGTDNILRVSNLGNGVALNIHIDDLRYKAEELKECYYRFTDIPMLPPNGNTTMIRASYHSGKIIYPDGQLAELTIHSTADYTLIITFQDLIGDKYEEQYQMGKSGIFFISHRLIPPPSKP